MRAAPDLLGREFTATMPDAKWCGDITYLRVGYSMADHMRAELVVDALQMALSARGGRVDGVIFHSDRGAIHV